jgi:hypothetical protein
MNSWWWLFTCMHDKLKGAWNPNEQIMMVFTQQEAWLQNWKLGALGNPTSSQPELVDTGAVMGMGFRAMDNIRTRIAHWHREL